MKKFIGEFKKFITRGNIVDMSVGVIVGGAFTSIVNALSDNILRPIINAILALVLGQDSLSGIYTYLKKVEVEAEVNGVPVIQVDLDQSIYIDWGAFINAIINFLIIALVLFTIVKTFNKLREQKFILNDRKKVILLKKEAGFKLTKKEIKFLKAEEEREAKEQEALEEEQRKAEEEKNKLTRSEELLIEIRDLLAKK
jgi:large conductance mechanosensitive channel